MDVKDKFIEDGKNLIQNKIRGEISYFSINQVADLLNEDVNNIKYYTNIFDDMLKIEIVNKELQYKNEDINKLEFLIKLKNKNMTLKEIQEYYNKISLNEDELKSKTSNLLSVEELINTVIKAEEEHFSKLRKEFIEDIKSINSEYLKAVTTSLIETQTKNLNDFKSTLSNEIKEYINENSLEFNTNLINRTDELISNKINEKNEELSITLHKDFEKFSSQALTNNETLIKEVQSFKRVINDAYYVHSEIDKTTSEGFLGKLFALFSN